jgi:DMSO/TMAO reductase YedYZ molybdopterin-dependent catalytic subunit
VPSFVCVEGWSVGDQRWSGVALSLLLDMAGPLAGANWVTFSAGEIATTLSLGQAREGIVALSLKSEPLPPERGGPM